MSSPDTYLPAWIKGDGPDSDVVVSTRARLARSLADFPFPSRASREDLSRVVDQVRTAASALTSMFPGLRSLDLQDLTSRQKAFLLDARIVSPEQALGGDHRAVIVEPGGRLSIMVNEEDHIRLQAVMSGFAPEDAWELVDWADDVLGSRVEYGFSSQYGYLTSSVSNVGTGLRVSVLMYLGGLAWMKKANAHLRAAFDLGVSVRGLFGEGSQFAGDMFQVSNEVTLGLTESEIVKRVRSVAQYLLEEERSARKELIGEERNRLMEKASRSLAKLQNARAVRSGEAITLISPLRLAGALGLVENGSAALFDELLVGSGLAAGDEPAANMERAEFLRNRLGEVHIGSC